VVAVPYLSFNDRSNTKAGKKELQTIYRDIEWAPRRGDDAVVWVNVKKVDSLWRLDEGFYIDQSLKGMDPKKYHNFGAWFSKNREAVIMPHISLLEGTIRFSNGRNRFSWLRDRGLAALPVTADLEEAAALKKAVGTRSRKSMIATHLIPTSE
jgi:hypothetical protein